MALRKGDSSLALHRLLFRCALSAGNIFAWMVVFRVFFVSANNLEESLAGVAALYALSQVITFFLTPLTGMALRRGVKRALTFGTLACAGAFIAIAALFSETTFSRESVFWLVALFTVMHGMSRALYWVPYKTAEAQSAEQSPSTLAREALVALMPAIAGYVFLAITHGPFIVFATIAAGIVAAALALFPFDESYEPFEWTFMQTLREFVARRNNLAVGLFILDGFQGAALLLIWPLAAFLLLKQSFVSLGAILTATLCVTFLARFIVRNILRALGSEKSPTITAALVFSSWILRLAAASPIQILAVDIYYNAGTSPRRYSIDSYAYEQSADGGHFVDEYTAIKEMGLAIGRIVLCILFITLALMTVESLAFAASLLVAAIAAAWSVFLANRLQKVL